MPDPNSERLPSAGASADEERTLRLVRIRLTLALVATAILPIAVAAPIVRLASDDSRSIQVARQSEIAIEVSRAASNMISEMRLELATLTATGEVSELVLRPKKADPGAARALIDDARSTRLAIASVVAVTDGEQKVRVTSGTGDIVGFSKSDSVGLVRSDRNGTWQVVLMEPIGSVEAGGAGHIVAVVPATAILDAAARRSGGSDHSIALIGVGDGVLATRAAGSGAGDSATPSGPATVTDSPLRARVTIPGIPGLAVVVTDPWAGITVGMPVLLALAALALVLIAFIAWMGRRILNPAAELDASRTRLRLAYDEAREAGLRDSLTGLGNHRAFQEEFVAIIDQARRYGHPMSLVLIDIDEFKLVNDSGGHAVGDDLLAEVGRLLRRVARQADRAFRVGGDEFALLLTHTDGEGAVQLVRRLLAVSLGERPDGRYVEPISFTAGISEFPRHGSTREEIRHLADAALYRGKRGGRTMVMLADPAVDHAIVDDNHRAVLSTKIARIVADRAIDPVFQPIVHLPTGRIIGFEGLSRPRPDSGFTDPGGLFAAAALTGRSVELDLTCLQAVIAGAAAIPTPALVSVNLSPRTLEAPEFGASRLLGSLDAARINPARVIIELTEHEAIEDSTRIGMVLERCREAGIRVAADDVGAGNAGLRLLSQFRFDVVKVDLTLVQAGTAQAPVREVLGTIVGLARRWGALVVAEGVETPVQLRVIRELGIEAGQGYLLGRPTARISTERIDIDALLESGDSPLVRLGLDATPVMREARPVG